MFSKLKCDPQQFRQWLLACDGEHLTGDLLGQLNKSLPSPDELKKLAELKNEINDLPEPEQYFCAVSSSMKIFVKHNILFTQISDIKRVQQRIRILLFKSQYKELLEEAEKVRQILTGENETESIFFLSLLKQLVTGRQACETVRRSKRFSKLIELVLTIGNYMNSSVKNYDPIYGFDMSFLPKVIQFKFDLSLSYFHHNSYMIQKQTMVNEHCYILFFKKSKRITKICYNSVMNFKVLVKSHQKVKIINK
jgi:diaphanous 3